MRAGVPSACNGTRGLRSGVGGRSLGVHARRCDRAPSVQWRAGVQRRVGVQRRAGVRRAGARPRFGAGVRRAHGTGRALGAHAWAKGWHGRNGAEQSV